MVGINTEDPLNNGVSFINGMVSLLNSAARPPAILEISVAVLRGLDDTVDAWNRGHGGV